MSLPSVSDALGEFRKPVTIRSEKLGRTYLSFVKDGKFFHREVQADRTGKTVFSDTREIAYGVGSGDRGRSYLVARADFLFVSPLSYYRKTGAWDLSPGYEEGQYEGFSRPVSDLCVYCHSDLPQPIPGTVNRFKRPPFRFLAIGCERCHGPGALHVRQRTRAEPLEGNYDPSIVNPSKLPHWLRDNVCEQCHLAGDARVLRPGKSYVDFRPGTALAEVVAIFSIPLRLKGTAAEAISQDVQMKISRCWNDSRGKLGCITCHDPHTQPRGTQAVQYFRKICSSCHAQESCRMDSKSRQATSPPDNCIACHMPKRQLATIAHTALTDHRILRRPGEKPQASLQAGSPPEFQDLIHETARPGSPREALDLRTRALAYAQVGKDFPIYAEPGLDLLERAAQQFPDDAEVQGTFGLVLLAQGQSNESRARAARALEKAIALHSTSSVVRTRLADLKLQAGYVNAAMQLLEEAIDLEPYYVPPHVALARIYLLLGNREKALETLQRVLTFDPGNESARRELEEVRTSP